MPWIETAAGERIHYEERGRELAQHGALLLISGWGGDAPSWEAELHYFGGRMHCLTLDHPGVGGQPLPNGLFTTADMADRIARGLEAMGIEQVFALGMSMGGAVAQELALRRPELVARCVLSGTFAKLDVRAARGVELATRLLESCDQEAALRMIYWLVFGADFYGLYADSLDSLLQDRLGNPIDLGVFQYQCQACLAHDARSRLSDIACPSLITHGTNDILVSERHAKELAAGIPGATLREFPGGGHCHLWEDAKGYREAVLAFLQS